MKKSGGQTLIESILMIPVIVIVFSMITWFSRIVLTRQQLVMASKYGTDMLYYSTMNETEIEEELKDYLCNKDNKGRKLNPDNLKFIIKKETFMDIDSINSLEDLDKLQDNFLNPSDHLSSVHLTYEFKSPPIFSAWNTFIPGPNLPEKIKVSAHAEVLAGTGVNR